VNPPNRTTSLVFQFRLMIDTISTIHTRLVFDVIPWEYDNTGVRISSATLPWGNATPALPDTYPTFTRTASLDFN
jgi:hypothetical protein